jgi:hypothetical protein
MEYPVNSPILVHVYVLFISHIIILKNNPLNKIIPSPVSDISSKIYFALLSKPK